MSDIAIRVENLSKQYRIGKRETYKTLRESLTDTVSAPFRRMRSMVRPSPSNDAERPSETIWALKDVSFEVPRGAVLGVIGRNGAGKSTLLKVLSRITEPTEGRVQIHGRVGSLLEVGTGFHGELSGRENIFLNGAILGMRRAEIRRKFDEIVAFAEVEKFIDTPVKHYSSGMYMRLAFAVAAHLEPEILIVDEVLAVGDAAFQKKCLGKIGDVAAGGRTVLFVSHNMGAVRALCTQCVVLDRGSISLSGSSLECVSAYLTSGRPENGGFSGEHRRFRSTHVSIIDAKMSSGGNASDTYWQGEPIELLVTVRVASQLRFGLEIIVRSPDGMPIAFCPSGLASDFEIAPPLGTTTIRAVIPTMKLAAGAYLLDLLVTEAGCAIHDWVEDALEFRLEPSPTGRRGWVFSQETDQGYVSLDVTFEEINCV